MNAPMQIPAMFVARPSLDIATSTVVLGVVTTRPMVQALLRTRQTVGARVSEPEPNLLKIGIYATSMESSKKGLGIVSRAPPLGGSPQSGFSEESGGRFGLLWVSHDWVRVLNPAGPASFPQGA